MTANRAFADATPPLTQQAKSIAMTMVPRPTSLAHPDRTLAIARRFCARFQCSSAGPPYLTRATAISSGRRQTLTKGPLDEQQLVRTCTTSECAVRRYSRPATDRELLNSMGLGPGEIALGSPYLPDRNVVFVVFANEQGFAMSDVFYRLLTAEATWQDVVTLHRQHLYRSKPCGQVQAKLSVGEPQVYKV